MKGASERSLELGWAKRQNGKRVTCWQGKLCTHNTCPAALTEGPVFHHSKPAAGRGQLPMRRRWWQSPEDSRQAEHTVWGHAFGGHSSSHAGA